MSFSLVKKTYSNIELFYFVTSKLRTTKGSMSKLYSVDVITPFLKDKEEFAILGIAEHVITTCTSTPFMADVACLLYRGKYADNVELQAVMVELYNNLQTHMNDVITVDAAKFPYPLDDAIVNTFLDMLSISKAYYIPAILDWFYTNSKEKAYQEFLNAEEVKKNKRLTGE